MGYSIYYDERRKRDLGYGVPAICDHPDCNEEIDRGLSYVCGGEPYSNEFGCALYFCSNHLNYYHNYKDEDREPPAYPICEQCFNGNNEFPMKPDTEEWVLWKLTDYSWQRWRYENKKEVDELIVKYNLTPEKIQSFIEENKEDVD